MTSKEIIKQLEKAGFECIKVVGSHHQYRHSKFKIKVTVPHPKKDLPIKTLISIEKQSGLKLRSN